MIGNYIKAVAVAVSRSTAKLMKTGQTTSYRTGDDGDIEAGRNTSFTVLAENNPFGNTNRFTDELGGQTYTNNIVIDWSTYDGSTVLGYKRTDNAGSVTWNTAIDGALLVSIGTFTTGWRLPNIVEIINICDWSLPNSSRFLGYSPFLLTGSVTYWSSTTSATLTSSAVTFANSSAIIQGVAKTTTTSMRYFAVRTFTVTGTTLS